MFSSLIIVLLLSLNAQADIVNGSKVSADSILSKVTVSLVMEYKGRTLSGCTGIALNSNVVITAGHCITSIVEPKLYISYGENPAANPVKYKVAKLKYYKPMFWSEMETGEDLAILLTESAMPNSLLVSIGDPTELSTTTNFIQAGYGFQSFEPGPVIPEYPDYGMLQMLSSGVFGEKQDHQVVIYNYNDTGVMGGDSGGPLFVENSKKSLILHGVLSTGGISETGGYHATYTVPYFFMSWINCSLPENLRIENYPTLNNQFPCDNKPMVSLDDFPNYNKSLCQAYRKGWGISIDRPTCFPQTKESCDELSNEVGGELYWDDILKSCEIKNE